MRTETLSAHARSAGPPAAVVVAAALAVALDGPAWLTTGLTAMAALLTAGRLVRRRQLGWADALVTGAAGLIVVLMLLGFLLNELPGGLARVPWAIGAGVAALLAIAASERRTASGAGPLDVDRRALLRLTPAYAAVAGLAAVALIVSVHATREATQAPRALSIVRSDGDGHVVVEIAAGRVAGRFELVTVSSDDELRLVSSPFSVAAHGHVRRTITLPARRRVTLVLRKPGSATSLRSLVVSPTTATGTS